MSEKIVAQLSDIHIGGTYNGSFDCIGNLNKVVNDLSKLPQLDMLIISGDLCDNHSEDEYIELQLQLHKLKLVFENLKIFAVGGNHDDFFKMVMFMNEVRVVEGSIGNFLFLNITDPTVGLSDYQKAMVIEHKPRNLVMHYPVGDCPHAFMHTEQHDIKNPVELGKFLVDNGVHDVFCGHYHNAYNSEYVENVCPSVHIAPSIQTQLSPLSITCHAHDKRPGYSLLTFDTMWELAQVKHIYLG